MKKFKLKINWDYPEKFKTEEEAERYFWEQIINANQMDSKTFLSDVLEIKNN